MAKALSEAKAAQLAAQADRERIQRKVPRGLKPRGFPDDPSPRFRGGIQARVSSSGVLTCRLCRVSRRGCVVSILRSPRLVSWGSSPGVPDPWYWLTFYAGSLPVPATAYVRRLDRTANGPVIKDRLFLSTFVGAASSTALERAWHPPRFIGDRLAERKSLAQHPACFFERLLEGGIRVAPKRIEGGGSSHLGSTDSAITAARAWRARGPY